MESNQNNFAAWIASGERSSYFSAHAHSAIVYDRRGFDLVDCCVIGMLMFSVYELVRKRGVRQKQGGESKGLLAVAVVLLLTWEESSQRFSLPPKRRRNDKAIS